ncbi:DUF397 domain-containing protein [Streptomyces sp. JV185]|uniref:DUF397 domain-containing protein n=1 Tax=Streptomyces sp. JV185 TaxID=858638 RepID=UPI002E7891FE|nr:DUF397 domain-containing protein [Streptomyces sp. JV185]
MDHGQVRWFKSSYSGGSGTECVEVADLASVIGVRDSKRPRKARLMVQRSAWTEFVRSLRSSECQGLAEHAWPRGTSATVDTPTRLGDHALGLRSEHSGRIRDGLPGACCVPLCAASHHRAPRHGHHVRS